MVRKTMILADGDRAYLERLSNYFMEKAPQLELNIFTDQALLLQHLAEAKADILLVDEGFADKEMAEKADAAVKLVLSGTMLPVEGFEAVRKYQKTERLLNEVLLKYAEATGSAEAIRGTSHTRTAAFYSPQGGSGKSVLALGMAVSCAKAGLRTFYLNLEEIDSVQGCLGRTPGSLSDIFLALKTKGMNVGIKLAACVGQEPSAGFFYLTGVDSISEYEEIEGPDIVRFVETVKSQAEYDVLLLDLSSGFSGKTVQTLEQADVIFVPVTSEEGAVEKISRFLREAELHDRYNCVFEKMGLIVNRVSSSGVGGILRESGLLSRVRCDALVAASPVFMKKSELLQSGDVLMPLYQPLLERLING